MDGKATRRVYSAEELHRLRCTISQPKLREAIEEHDGDDAELVKEHVLRGSKSFAARSWKSRASIASRATSGKENRSTTNNSDNDRPTAALAAKPIPVLGGIAPNNQLMRPIAPLHLGPSPTPSLRKKKIESLVKAHGSPDHVRVTAGGRIVPSDQSPLCQPRYGYSAVKVNGGLVKLAPCHPMGKAQWTQATQNGFVAQDVNGRLCQIVDGTILPLHETEAGLQLYIPAPNLNITQRASPVAARQPGPARFAGNGSMHQPPTHSMIPEPSFTSQLNALEVEYSKLEHELKDVDKTEVLHGRTMGKGAKDALIGKRRELVINLDRIRKALKSLREQAPANVSPPQPFGMGKQAPSPPRSRLPPFLQQRQHNLSMATPPAPAPMFAPLYAPGSQHPPPFAFQQTTPSPDSAFGNPWTMPPPALFAPPPPFDGSMSTTNLSYPTQPEPFMGGISIRQAQPPVQLPAEMPVDSAALPQHDGSASFADVQRAASPIQSHALSIKPDVKPFTKSNLNPMSPVYKPGAGLLQQPASETRKASSTKSIKDRAPTPMSPLHQLQQSASSLMVAKISDATTDSPTKASTVKQHVQSSSVSSFETADFFPRNTAEYSNRKYASASQLESAEKEVVDLPPVTPAKDTLPHGHPRSVIPAAPPGTPIDGIGLPDRTAHNMSPKGRNWRFVEELPADIASQPTPSPEKPSSRAQGVYKGTDPAETRAAETDAAEKSLAWIEGYRAGRLASSHESQVGSDLLSRPPSAIMSTTSLGSRLSLPPAGRIFSGLFAQIDGAPQQSLAASVHTENVHAPATPDLKASPTKTSPARQKFERIAESVGIKVAGEVSPGKRRWRDVWRASKC